MIGFWHWKLLCPLFTLNSERAASYSSPSGHQIFLRSLKIQNIRKTHPEMTAIFLNAVTLRGPLTFQDRPKQRSRFTEADF